jgi:CMP/dCMP kinase
MPLQIAIDGPVASGKSTVAKRLAERLGFAFLDTGALYRAVAYAALQKNVSSNDHKRVGDLISLATPDVVQDEQDPLSYRIRMNGELLGPELFTPQVSQAVSPIAAMPKVRHRLIASQRAFGQNRDVVMAGRDIGTVVLPHAQFKFFLTASVDARVNRRWRELKDADIDLTPEALRDEIVARDLRDTGRAVSPLRKAPDAIEVDTSDMSVDEVVRKLEHTVTTSKRT